MKLRKELLMASVVLVSLSLGEWRASAQQPEDPVPEPTPAPKPAARAYFPVLDTDDKNEQDADASQDADALRPDTRPLTGLQTPTVGTRDYRHSFLVPGFQYGGTFLSHNLNLPGPAGCYSNTYLLGTLSVL